MALVAVAVATAGLLYVVGSWYTGEWDLSTSKAGPQGTKPIPWGEFVKIAAPAVTLLVATVAAVLAAHGHTSRLQELAVTRAGHDLDRDSYALDQDTRLVDNFTKAVEQLGSNKTSVALGGIHALGRLARVSEDQATTIVQILTAHLMLKLRQLAAMRLELDGYEENGFEGDQIPNRLGTYSEHPLIVEIETVLRVLAALRAERPHLDFNLEHTHWPAVDWSDGLQMADSQAIRLEAPGVHWTSINLARADLTKANFAKADLQRANLRGANLQGAKIEQASFVEADLTGAILSTWGPDGEQPRLGGGVGGVEFDGANFTGANLTRAQLAHTVLDAVNFSEANLSEANLRGSVANGLCFDKANLTGAKLVQVNMSDSTLTGADLTGADLTGANLSRANLAGACFDNAILVNTNFADAQNVPSALGDILSRRAPA